MQKVYQYETPRKYVLVDQYNIEQTKNDRENKNKMNDANSASNVTPKCVKCSNVVVNQTEIKSKNIEVLSKHFAKRTYLDNMTQLEIELRKESSMVMPRKNFSEILNKKLK